MAIAKLILALLLTAHAGRFKDFCERHLIANDPWPYAEHTTEQLFDLPNDNQKSTEELIFRYRHGMMTGAEVRAFWAKFKPGHK